MNIELRKVTINKRLSEETTCFSADVWIDGVKVGTVGNRGEGGPNEVWPRELETRLDAYCDTLPPAIFATGEAGQTTDVLPMSSDILIGRLLDAYEAERELKRLLAKKIVYRKADGKLYTATTKTGNIAFLCKGEATVKAALKAEAVLNLMPFDAALSLYRSLTEVA